MAWFAIDSARLPEVRRKSGPNGFAFNARDDEGFVKLNFPANLQYEEALRRSEEIGKPSLGHPTTKKGFAVRCHTKMRSTPGSITSCTMLRKRLASDRYVASVIGERRTRRCKGSTSSAASLTV